MDTNENGLECIYVCVCEQLQEYDHKHMVER